MLKDRENILNALREKPLKAYPRPMRGAPISPNEEACQSLLLKMRDEGLGNSISQRALAHRIVRYAAGRISRRLSVYRTFVSSLLRHSDPRIRSGRCFLTVAIFSDVTPFWTYFRCFGLAWRRRLLGRGRRQAQASP